MAKSWKKIYNLLEVPETYREDYGLAYVIATIMHLKTGIHCSLLILEENLRSMNLDNRKEVVTDAIKAYEVITQGYTGGRAIDEKEDPEKEEEENLEK